MRVLVACEESQRVCTAFRDKGHEAYSCDLLECSGGHPEWHIQGDVLKVLNPWLSESDLSFGIHFTTMDGKPHFVSGKWDLIIAHPPCTFMSKAGARWMYKGGELNLERYDKALAAKQFFTEIFSADCPKIVIENPTPLRCVGLPAPTQIIQPYHFDSFDIHPFSKRTCLWIKGDIPLLKATTPERKPIDTYVCSNTSLYSKGYCGSRGVAADSRERSKTFLGVAAAMADQWG